MYLTIRYNSVEETSIKYSITVIHLSRGFRNWLFTLLGVISSVEIHNSHWILFNSFCPFVVLIRFVAQNEEV